MDRLEREAAALAHRYPGPGGAVAVVRDGAVVLRHAWGYANAERRIAFTPATLFRICSITKQFTCALVLDAFPDPTVLDAAVRDRLPLLEGAVPGALHLCHNQSGLRDYWALAMLHGAPAESPFGEAEATRVIGAARTLHFAPGSRYAYCNQNFRILSDIVQQRTGRSFAELLRARVLAPAGMQSAFLAADTRAMPDGTEGYEQMQQGGFRPAENRVIWTGDAGLGASLDDMIAWERRIDATRDDADSLYRRLSVPVRFVDGAPAVYGFGLRRDTEQGREVIGHGGALRGWRSHRLHVAAERLSVVVLFNHLANAHDAALDLLAAALDETRPTQPAPAAPAPDWCGAWMEPESGLAARIDPGPGGLRLRYGHSAEALALQEAGAAAGDGVTLRVRDGALHMQRPGENLSTVLHRPPAADGGDITGEFRCAEMDAVLSVASLGGVPHGGFSGFLGQGRMEMLEQVAADVWMLPCPRALDHTPPGDWTLAFSRDAAGRVNGVEVGCWLARRLRYVRA
jgi:D-aminopeptidase